MRLYVLHSMVGHMVSLVLGSFGCPSKLRRYRGRQSAAQGALSAAVLIRPPLRFRRHGGVAAINNRTEAPMTPTAESRGVAGLRG